MRDTRRSMTEQRGKEEGFKVKMKKREETYGGAKCLPYTASRKQDLKRREEVEDAGPSSGHSPNWKQLTRR